MISDAIEKQRPAEIELRVLKHSMRYGLTTALATSCTVFGSGEIDDRTERLLDGMVRQKLLAKFAVTESQRAFVVAERGKLSIGAENDTFDCRQSHRSLITCLAMLNFCCVKNEDCLRITNAEVSDLFPGLERAGAINTHYIRSANVRRVFGVARVDFGGTGSWQRTVQKTVEKARQFMLMPAYARLAHAQRLEFVVLTTMPEKAQRIEERLREYQHVFPVRMLAVPIPELLPLVAPLPS